ncbi:MAG TPA: DUF222 domain-containing protein [Candidatus Dormibacteraeota bacterium]|nr:DUF222 domain-containing protein [Candidatus Dormibacteraeota bacterium]
MDSMAALKAAVTAFRSRDQSTFTTSARGEELRELREMIDALEVEFSSSARAFQLQGGHLADGFPGTVSWLRQNCKMSGPSAADRVCVGKELESLPHIAEALATGRLGFQAAAAICHLFEQAAERRDHLDEVALVAHAAQMGVAEVRDLCRRVRYAIDPDGSEREEEFNFSRRRLHISALADGMHVIDAILDPVSGAAVKTALEALATGGPRDGRKHSQRMADALVEMAHHAMDEGKLPTNRGVKAHLNVSTTFDALQGRAGTSELESMPISQKTMERFCCDCTASRVMFAESVPIDVGRATRVIHPATRRALRARDKRCRWQGCDRPINWTSAHHIEFWGRGGSTRTPNLVSLCWFHHRLVHEGGWQVVKAGEEYRFIAPQQRSVLKEWRARGPGYNLAA